MNELITAQGPNQTPASPSEDRNGSGPPITPPAPKIRKGPLWQALAALASLRLTVFLFVLAILIVLFGTLAQRESSLQNVINTYFRGYLRHSFFVMVPCQLFFPSDFHVPGSFPFLSGWVIGVALLVNLLAAHAVRFKVSWKRSGILLIHSGLVVLMVSELLTGIYSVEGYMTIDEGKSSNFVEHNDAAELAIVDPSDPKTDAVVVVPAALLQKHNIIQNDQLPFDVEVVRYLPNSALLKKDKSKADDPATVGAGLQSVAVPQGEIPGTDTKQGVDVPSAYLIFKKKGSGEALGTYLMSVFLKEQPVRVEGKSFDVSLRFKRSYYPFTLQLEEFRFDRYTGTEKAKNFSSRVRLLDPDNHADRTLTISMNAPLRHEGLTFYQADFDKDTEKTTVLQVVHNPAVWWPYISCALVTLGMVVHFGILLVGFLGKIMAQQAAVAPLNSFTLLMPWGAVVLAGLLLLVTALPSHEDANEMHLQRFGQLPVVEGGRVKPLDTLARNSLMVVSERQDFVDKDGHKQSAIKWLLDVMTSHELIENRALYDDPVFRIDHDQILYVLELQPRSGFRYAFSEFGTKLSKLAKRKADTFDPDKPKNDFEASTVELGKRIQLVFDLAALENLRVVPSKAGEEKWLTLGEAVREERTTGQKNLALHAFIGILNAYAQKDVPAFNDSLDQYQKATSGSLPPDAGTVSFESFFNHLQPFYWGMVLYVVIGVVTCGGFLLACAGHKEWAQAVNRSAFALVIFTLVLHTWAIWGRMHIQGRPPVTNLYSSAVFIGWGCVVLGLVLEVLFRIGIGNLLAAVTGFLTLIVAHNLAAGGDTLEMMQAVLDTNFWLATHVTCVTLGYTATFVAGFLGIAFIILGVPLTLLFRRLDLPRFWLNRDLFKVLSTMIYGIVCFATLLSFTGTVLGGIWADQSWGRFWGWDPKENGALIIVLWNALVLHARWAGLVKQCGMAALAVGGNIVTAWSWFGVNMLGIGLHSYGFMAGAAFWLSAFVVVQLGIIVVGVLPSRMWPNLNAAPPEAKPPTRGKGGRGGA